MDNEQHQENIGEPGAELEQQRNAEEQPQKPEAYAVRTASPGPNEQWKAPTYPGECEAREKNGPCEMSQCQQWIRRAIVDEPCEDEDSEMHDRRCDQSSADA